MSAGRLVTVLRGIALSWAMLLRTRSSRALGLSGSAQARLEAAERYHRALIEHSLDIVTVIEVDGTLRYSSPSGAALFGREMGGLVGKNSLDYLHPEDRPRARKALKEIVANPGVGKALEIRFLHMDGSYRTLEIIGTNLLDNPAVRGVVLNSRDVTERRAMEDHLRQLSSAIESIGDTVMITDREGVIMYVNPAFEALTGFPRGAALGRTPRILKSGEQTDAFYQEMWQTILSGRAFRATFVNRRKDGEIFLEEKTVTPIADPTGALTAFVATGRDVTEQRRVEEQLRASEARYRLLFAASPLPMWLFDLETLAFLAVNEAAVRRYGYSEQEFLAMTIRDIRPSEDVSRLEAQLSRGGSARHSAEIWRHVKKDGTTIQVEIVSHHLEFAGRLAALVLSVDVTERLKAEAHRRTLEDQLRQAQKMESLGQLTGGIAHDFNNLLAVILTNAELLLSAPERGRSHDDSSAKDILAAGHRGRTMVKKLMAFSRQGALELAPLDLNGVVRESVEMLGMVLPETIEVTTTLAAGLTPVYADAGAIAQILVNLMTNARDAMPQGGALQVQTGLVHVDPEADAAGEPWRPGSYACLTVRDTGTGMDEETRRRVFEPFFTTKEAGRGTGLGMAMVYGLVRQHGGHIAIESEPGLGTTIRVCLPTEGVAPLAALAAPAPESPVGGTETILVVDDAMALRRAAQRALERHGYRVLVAGDGEEALAILEKWSEPIHLVVTDAVMPRLGGRGLYDAARRSGLTMPFILTTGYASPDDVIGEGQRDDVAFLAKPWTVADLLGRIREVLDERADA